MLNKIWFWLLLIGILYGFGKAAIRTAIGPAAESAASSATDAAGRAAADDHSPLAGGESAVELLSAVQPLRDAGRRLTDAALGAAKSAVELCIVLIGLMALWLGMLNVARDAGMVDALARFLQPAMRWLFPDVPDGHPAQGAILMNISANMLGLGNAATPFGLKAMRELQTLNPTKETATNAMATFLAINTSSVTLVPFTIIGLRVAAGSSHAAKPMAAIILTTSVSTAVAIVAARILARLPRYAMPAGTESLADASDELAAPADD
jgi:spore maturation protein A